LHVLRNPVAQFVVAATLIVFAVAVGTDLLSRRAAEREAVSDARFTTELLARSVAEPAIPYHLYEARRRCAASTRTCGSGCSSPTSPG
jgi:two-component system NarL family sensor kinase